MKPKMIYCHGEPGEFPETEFFRDDKGRLVHNVEEKHDLNGNPWPHSSVVQPPELYGPPAFDEEEVEQ